MTAMLSLAACATAASEPPALCPPVVDYTPAEQAQAAAELERLPESGTVVRMMIDYAVLRDQARACGE